MQKPTAVSGHLKGKQLLLLVKCAFSMFCDVLYLVARVY